MLLPSVDDKPALRITLFGGLSIQQKDRPAVELPPQQSAALFAYLALNSRRAQSREVLIGLLWPESVPEKARQNLRQCLHSLRDLLEKPPFLPGSVLLTTRTSIQLNPQCVSTDVADFENALESAHKMGDRAERILLLSRAAELFCGELLPGFYQDCFVLEQRRLAERHREALGLLIADLETVGDYKQALPYALRVVLLDPLSEEAHCALMRLYAAMGQPAAVQRVYLDLKSRLERELGEGPDEETHLLAKRLQEDARRQSISRPEDPVIARGAKPKGAVQPLSEDASSLILMEQEPTPSAPSLPPHSVSRRRGPEFLAASAFVLLAFLFWRAHHAAPSLSPPSKFQIGSQQGVKVASGLPGVFAPLAHSEPHPFKPTDTAPAVGLRIGSNPAKHSAPTRLSGRKLIMENPGSGGFAGPQHAEKPLSNETGDVLWAAHFKPLPGDAAQGGNEPTAMTVDSFGNIYVTGFVRTLKTDVDYLTLKYSPEGKLLWQQRYNGPGNDLDRARAIAVDPVGNVYVTGESDGGKGHGSDHLSGLDIATIKYGSDGKQLWVQRYAGDADGRDSGHKIALDGAGNVYVFGQSWNNDPTEGGTGFDLILIKYSPAGQELWKQRYPGRANEPDMAVDMAVDSVGNAFLTGMAGQSNHLPAIVTLKYDANGKQMWEHVYAGREGAGAEPTCIVLDGNQNVYVVGHEAFAVSESLKKTMIPYDAGSESLVLKYQTTGEPLWRQDYRWPGYGEVQFPQAAVCNGTSNLFVTGWIRAEGEHPWCGTLDYASDGALLWHNPYRTPGHRGFYVRAMGVNSVGDVLLAGWGTYLDPTRPGEDTYELTALQYAPEEGKIKTSHRYAASPYDLHNAVLMNIDRHDNVIVCGHAFSGALAVITTVKFRP